MSFQSAIKHIVLADDDKDDCHFLKDVLDELALDISITIVHDGKELMTYLETISATLPDVLFLDLNMPRKNGAKCLIEIKNNPALKKLPVIIYSTSYDEEKVNQFREQGANHYICKPTAFKELKNVVHMAITLLNQNKLLSSKEKFYINELQTEFPWRK